MSKLPLPNLSDLKPVIPTPEERAAEEAYIDEETFLLAIHEAGHVIAAIAVKRYVHEVTIIPTPETEWGGHAMIEESIHPEHSTEKNYLDLLCIVCAGIVATELFYEATRAAIAANELPDLSDMERYAIEYTQACGMPLGDSPCVLEIGFQRTRALLELHRELIELLANELYERETMTAQEIYTFLSTEPIKQNYPLFSWIVEGYLEALKNQIKG